MVTLTIRFLGMCLPAPDLEPSPNVGGQCLHVLLPEFGDMEMDQPPPPGGHMHHHPIHHARLVFHPKYDGSLGPRHRCVNLEGRSIDVLAEVQAADRPTSIEPIVKGENLHQLVDISGLLAARYVARKFVDASKKKPAGLQSRITLTAGTGEACDPPSPAPLWETRPTWKEKIMSTSFTWTITDLPDAPLKLCVRDLAGGQPVDEVVLRADENDQILLSIYNAATYDLPPYVPRAEEPRRAGSQADHFGGYYAFFEIPESERVIPTLMEPVRLRAIARTVLRTECKGLGSSGDTDFNPTVTVPRTPASDTCSQPIAFVEPYTAIAPQAS